MQRNWYFNFKCLFPQKCWKIHLHRKNILIDIILSKYNKNRSPTPTPTPTPNPTPTATATAEILKSFGHSYLGSYSV